MILEIRIPATAEINSANDLWLALKHLLPTIFAFLLSFMIILITWVNHHNSIKLVDKTSAQFAYANGFLLLTVVFIPFPTALLGEYLLTDKAAPAVVLYTANYAFQAFGWTLISRIALKQKLAKNEITHNKMQKIFKDSFLAITLYTVCAVLAFWYPLIIASAITPLWIFWLIYGINLKEM